MTSTPPRRGVRLSAVEMLTRRVTALDSPHQPRQPKAGTHEGVHVHGVTPRQDPLPRPEAASVEVGLTHPERRVALVHLPSRYLLVDWGGDW